MAAVSMNGSKVISRARELVEERSQPLFVSVSRGHDGKFQYEILEQFDCADTMRPVERWWRVGGTGDHIDD